MARIERPPAVFMPMGSKNWNIWNTPHPDHIATTANNTTSYLYRLYILLEERGVKKRIGMMP
jgi:hypothetical protein